MSVRTNPLAQVSVAAPCPAEWNSMLGNERVRFCAECKLNVYNLSGMTRQEAEKLVVQAEGRLCVRFYRRPDGTILTRNCPVGLRAVKRRLTRLANASISALLGFCAGLLAVTGLHQRLPVLTRVQDAIIKMKQARPDFDEREVMGTYAAPEEFRGRMVMGEIIKPERPLPVRRGSN
ncbi:MAG TPA: hypothetical protein VF723_13970 [Pyrinomonadaceae bacterium]